MALQAGTISICAPRRPLLTPFYSALTKPPHSIQLKTGLYTSRKVCGIVPVTDGIPLYQETDFITFP
jgi:hypothetical protein